MAVGFPRRQFRDGLDIVDATKQDSEVLKIVTSMTSRYQTVNVATAMRDLTKVGDLLKLAYAGSKGSKCCKNVVMILTRYQRVIKDSANTTTAFLDASISAIKFHSLALKLAATKPDKAITFVAKCAEQAGAMEKQSALLVNAAEELSDLAEKALIEATQDETTSHEQRTKLQERLGELKAQEAKLKAQTTELTDGVEEERQKEERASKKADLAQQRQFAIALVGSVTAPALEITKVIVETGKGVVGGVAASVVSAVSHITGNKAATAEEPSSESKQKDPTELDKSLEAFSDAQAELTRLMSQLKEKQDGEAGSSDVDASTLQNDIEVKKTEVELKEKHYQQLLELLGKQAETELDKEAKAVERRVALQKELRAANALLAESVTRLANMKEENNSLDQAIASLEVAVGTLAKIRTVFENTRLFWKGVARQTNMLADMTTIELLNDPDTLEELKGAITESAFSWLTLGNINYSALQAMKLVSDGVDDTMNNLPTQSESLRLVQKLSVAMLEELTAEDKDGE